jgi:RNA polymerase sigma factor (sigma-70 family)
MPAQVHEVIPHLRRMVLRDGESDLPDGELLGRFIDHRDEAAFAALVRRHGPMVWAVCRRTLCTLHDAEDAFQATFLVLVRRAGSVRQRELVGHWLYGVARQTARKAQATARRRQQREIQGMAPPDVQLPEPGPSHELEPFLDQELGRLPEKYRVAIVLCDLGGKTRKEAARQLGVPEGTLAGRLARGRALLAKRLARHDQAVSGGALAAVLLRQAAWARMPVVMTSTIRAVLRIAACETDAAGVVPAQIAALTEGVLKAMSLSKLKTAAGACLAAGLIALVAARAFPWATATPSEPPAAHQGPGPGKAARQPAAQPLAGAWRVVSVEDYDKKALEFDPVLNYACGIRAPVRVNRFTFRGDQFVLKTGPVSLEGTYAVDLSPTRRWLVLTIPVESPGGIGTVSVVGKLSIEGDTARIRCNDLAPSELTALSGGKPGVCYTLRREATGK